MNRTPPLLRSFDNGLASCQCSGGWCGRKTWPIQRTPVSLTPHWRVRGPWLRERDLHTPMSAYETDLELPPGIPQYGRLRIRRADVISPVMVGTAGIEPATYSMSTKCSTAELGTHNCIRYRFVKLSVCVLSRAYEEPRRRTRRSVRTCERKNPGSGIRGSRESGYGQPGLP